MYNYEIYYKQNSCYEKIIIVSDTINEALETFEKNYPDAKIQKVVLI